MTPSARLLRMAATATRFATRTLRIGWPRKWVLPAHRPRSAKHPFSLGSFGFAVLHGSENSKAVALKQCDHTARSARTKGLPGPTVKRK
jgi:hypothetical protein